MWESPKDKCRNASFGGSKGWVIPIWRGLGGGTLDLRRLGGGLQFSGVLGWGDPNLGGQWVGEPKFGVVLEVSGWLGRSTGQMLGGKPPVLWGFWFKGDNP